MHDLSRNIDNDELLAICERLPSIRALVIGDVMVDEYIWGSVERISPEAPVPVVEIQSRTSILGGAGNVAANIVALNADFVIGTVVGDDASAEDIRESLQVLGAGIDGVIVEAGRRTTRKTRVMAHSQQMLRMDYEDATAANGKTEDRLLTWALDQLRRCDVCILSDYAKGVISERVSRELIRAAAETRTPLVVDPKGADYRKYAGATLIKPNSFEVERVVGRRLRGEGDLERAGHELLRDLGCSALLISQGPHGMILLTPDGSMQIPSSARSVFDVTGAGDTAVSTVSVALACGATFAEAACFGNEAAGIVVGKLGTSVVSREELRFRLRQRLADLAPDPPRP